MIYHTGDAFLVSASELQDGEAPNKMFVGTVSIDRQGTVTHLWLQGIGDVCHVGYPVEMLKPVRLQDAKLAEVHCVESTAFRRYS